MEAPPEQAVSVSFLVLATGQLWHVFNARDSSEPVFCNEITRNRYVWGAIALCAGLLMVWRTRRESRQSLRNVARIPGTAVGCW